MSGHSKWSQIKRQKAVTDNARSKVFAKFSRLITLESKQAQGDTTTPGLANTIARAKAENMPKDNIERAVAKGISKDTVELERVVYECYGPGGTAVIIDALTDSRNRTSQEIKHLLSKQGYDLATPGSASWAFTQELDGTYKPNEQTLLDVSDDEEEKLGFLLSVLDENDDVQVTYTNARGYEDTRD